MIVNQELERFVGKSNPPIGANGHAQGFEETMIVTNMPPYSYSKTANESFLRELILFRNNVWSCWLVDLWIKKIENHVARILEGQGEKTTSRLTNLTSTPHKAGEVLTLPDSNEESDDISMPTSKKSRQEIGQGKRLKTKEAIKQGKQIKGSAKTMKKK